jgi:hypothetical protein
MRVASRGPTDFRDERVDVAGFQLRIEQAAIEIAVIADSRAERYVEINP